MTNGPDTAEAEPNTKTAAAAADDPNAETAARARPPRGQGAAVLAVSVGGGLGAAARYGAGLLWPAAGPGAFPLTTLGINAVGCALIGVLMVLVAERPASAPNRPRPLLRPFLGTGVLGGFTTFSTYAVDIERLAEGGHAATALAYLAATLTAALLSVWAAATLTRRLTKARTP
jgi:fluoride exporter